MKKTLLPFLLLIILVFTNCGIEAKKNAQKEKQRIELEDKKLFIDIIKYVTNNQINRNSFSKTGGADGLAKFDWIWGNRPALTITNSAYVHQTMGFFSAEETGDLSFIRFNDDYQSDNPGISNFVLSAYWFNREAAGDGDLNVYFDMINNSVQVRIVR